MESGNSESQKDLVSRINRLKKEKNAVVLVHFYQSPEIYQVADFLGDSYELSYEASRTKADIIIFGGVHFMAESASILNPDKKVILPAVSAGCPMAETADAVAVQELRGRHPDAAVVSYMNTTAEVKAISDIICTSSNAVKIVNSIPQKKIIFVPDKNLGSWVAKQSDKEIIPWKGYCYVHTKFPVEELRKAKEHLPAAKVVVHPECPEEVRELADHVCSTSGMVKYVAGSDAIEFIIGTETGMVEYLKMKFPQKRFYSVPPGSTCMTMKKNRLELVLEALQSEKPEIRVSDEIRINARKALQRMIEVTQS